MAWTCTHVSVTPDTQVCMFHFTYSGTNFIKAVIFSLLSKSLLNSHIRDCSTADTFKDGLKFRFVSNSFSVVFSFFSLTSSYWSLFTFLYWCNFFFSSFYIDAIFSFHLSILMLFFFSRALSTLLRRWILHNIKACSLTCLSQVMSLNHDDSPFLSVPHCRLEICWFQIRIHFENVIVR